MNLPEKFIENMKLLFKDDFQSYIESFEQKRVYGLRVNTLKISPDEFLAKNVFDLSRVPWCENGFYYNEIQRPSKHPYYYAGLYYLQEPSAMAPAAVLNIEENDCVLDMCAAPGGKSTAIGAKLNGTGVLVCNDISASRTKALIKNIELFGIKNAVVTSETPEKLALKFDRFFNKILVDAPCSGEGMFRKDPDIVKSWNENSNNFYSQIQKNILENASKMLSKGGYILYSTCTFSPVENEMVIDDFLKKHKNFEIIPLSQKRGFEMGKVDALESPSKNIEFCGRLFPHKIKGEGHFLALIHNIEIKEEKNTPPVNTVIDDRFKYFQEFKNNYLKLDFNGIFYTVKDKLYLLPKSLPDLNRIRVLKSGWFLGEFKKGRFEPSQALAMGLSKNQCLCTVDFSIEQSEVLKYLKGDTLETCLNGKGYKLICVDSFPLGWAKLQDQRLKNKYLAGWKFE